MAIYFKVFPGYPVIVAANRDEYLDRPATTPTILASDPEVVGGRDLQAGGTWLGMNEHGLITGLLNRSSDLGPRPNLRSRGLLCLDALGFRSAAEAANYASRQRGADYNFFNLLMASRDQAFVAYNRADGIALAELEPGLHLLTNLNLNDFECPRISRAYDRFAALAQQPPKYLDVPRMRDQLAALLADHATQLDARSGRPNALCLHLNGYGTRSSSVIFLDSHGEIDHFFAEGPPCKARFERALVPRAGRRA